MKLHFPTRLPRPQFTLRTLFIAVTLLSVWLGYHVNWVHQRREARKWLIEHCQTTQPCEIGALALQRELPWTLKLLGEQPMQMCNVIPNTNEQTDLQTYRRRVGQICTLFPECPIVDISVFLEEIETEDQARGYR